MYPVNETATLGKYVYKHKNMRKKWMIEFLGKFENRSIKIARVNSIIITKSINLQLCTLILYGFGGPSWSYAIFSVQSIYREVCVITYTN